MMIATANNTASSDCTMTDVWGYYYYEVEPSSRYYPCFQEEYDWKSWFKNERDILFEQSVHLRNLIKQPLPPCIKQAVDWIHPWRQDRRIQKKWRGYQLIRRGY